MSADQELENSPLWQNIVGLAYWYPHEKCLIV